MWLFLSQCQGRKESSEACAREKNVLLYFGTQARIDADAAALERGTFIHIENMEVRPIPPAADERSFRTED